MFNKYPYTDFHELNLDYMLDLCRRTMGLHLETSGDFLKLVNKAGEDISKLKVTYADKALTDMDGHDIRAFILDAGIDGRRLVFDRGNGEYVSITVPYATSAEQDVNGNSITDYVKNISVSGDNVLITFGNGTTTAITVPFATKASQDTNGKSLTTYVAELSTGNDKLIVKDGDGVTLAELTIPYAVKARDDYDGDDIRTTYGTDLTVGQTTVILRDKETNVLSEITVPYAVSAQTDNNGAQFRSSYGAGLTTGSNKVQLTAPNGSVLSDITVPFATVSTDASNAIESVSISGDNIVFTTYGGQSFSITCPYAVKALKDDLNNTLSHTYIANAVNDPLTGKITFYAQDGSVIAEMTPTVDRATHDNLGNDIADYIKAIVTDPNSNYVTVTHGDGTADSLTINYATKAWKDTYGNVIGNVYIRSLSIITDSNTGKKVLVAYNGELSELFRIELDAQTAVNDVNGTPITDYVTDVTLSGTDLDIEHGDGTVNTIALPQTELTPIIVKFDDQTTDILSVSFKGSTEQLTASEVKRLFNEGHAIYATPSSSSGTVFFPVSEYVDTSTNTVFMSMRTVTALVSGNSTIVGETHYQFDIDNGTYISNMIPLSKPTINVGAVDTPTGTINAGDTITRDVVIDITGHRTMSQPILAYCTAGSTWNDFVHVVNARIQATSGATEVIVRYLIYNPTATAQTLQGDVNIGLYV